MEKFIIDGGIPLEGTLTPTGNKNAALPILASCLLTEEEVVVRNVPRIRDVDAMIAILSAIGVRVQFLGNNDVSLCAAVVHESTNVVEASWAHDAATVPAIEVDPELAEQIRASFLLAGPLLARFHRAVMPPPGGDVIGRRRLDPHLHAFSAMGAEISSGRNILLDAPHGLHPTDVFLDEPSVMATENALMAAALIPGTTIIGNAACEPHVQDLARMLVKMGADIQGIGSNLLTINGAESLRGAEHTIAPDHIEIGSFMALAGVTGGELRIKDTRPADLSMLRLVFQRLGLTSEIDGDDVLVPGGQKLLVRSDHRRLQEQDPGWPVADVSRPTSPRSPSRSRRRRRAPCSCTSGCSRTASSSPTSSSRWAPTSCSAILTARSSPALDLRGDRVESPDIRAGMAMLLAALCAEGRSEIGNIRQIDRGYERIDERLHALGARIERVAIEPVPA